MIEELKQKFTQYKIPFREHGKNVGREHINICCPLCDEQRFHCGIHINKLFFHCWVCNGGGSWEKLKVYLYKKYPLGNWNEIKRNKKTTYQAKPKHKVHIIDYFYNKADKEKQWLSNLCSLETIKDPFRPRWIKPNILDNYDIRIGVDKYKDYIGFIQDNNLIARKFNKNSYGVKWLKHLNQKPFIFNFNICKISEPNVGFITEGIFDCMRFPYGSAIAIMGHQISNQLLSKVVECFEKTNTIVLALDRDVNDQIIQKLYINLHSLGYNVKTIDWSKVDSYLKDIDEIYIAEGEKYIFNLLNVEKSVIFTDSILL